MVAQQPGQSDPVNAATVCPLCGGGELHAFLARRQVPVLQNILLSEPVEAKAVARGDLDFAACRDCGRGGELTGRDLSHGPPGPEWGDPPDSVPARRARGAHAQRMGRGSRPVFAKGEPRLTAPFGKAYNPYNPRKGLPAEGFPPD